MFVYAYFLLLEYQKYINRQIIKNLTQKSTYSNTITWSAIYQASSVKKNTMRCDFTKSKGGNSKNLQNNKV